MRGGDIATANIDDEVPIVRYNSLVYGGGC